MYAEADLRRNVHREGAASDAENITLRTGPESKVNTAGIQGRLHPMPREGSGGTDQPQFSLALGIGNTRGPTTNRDETVGA